MSYWWRIASARGRGFSAPAGFEFLTGLDGTILTGADLQPLLGISQGAAVADTTAPTITSSNAVSLAENVALSHTLTADETVTWTKTGGADQALFTLAGSNLSMTAKDFEIPADADANNTYIVQVTATDTALNATNQTITVTVTDVAEGAYSAEAEALFLRMTTPPNTTRKGVIDTYIVALKNAGCWALLDMLHVMAAADSQAAGLNWMSTSFPLTPVNAPTFTADRGYTFNGTTQECTTGFAPSVNGVQLQRNSAHIGDFALTAGASTGFDYGETTGTVLASKARTGANGSVRVNFGSTLASSAGGTVPIHVMGIRRVSTTALCFRAGVQVATAAQTSAALSANTVGVGRAISLYSDRQIAITHLGGAFDDTQALAFYNASLAYLQAVGAA